MVEWKRIKAGRYEHPRYGKVWKERRGWFCLPRRSLACGPFNTLHRAKFYCEREAF